MMDAKRLREIEAREKVATAGPWREGTIAFPDLPVWVAVDAPTCSVAPGKRVCVAACGMDGNDKSREDATFIASSRQDVPDLCAEVRRLRDVILDLAAVAEECAQDCDRHDVEDNVKRQLDGIHAAVAEARAAIAVYEVSDG